MICPILSLQWVSAAGEGGNTVNTECLQGQCAWWTIAYTTEGHQHHGCALQVLAMAAGKVEP